MKKGFIRNFLCLLLVLLTVLEPVAAQAGFAIQKVQNLQNSAALAKEPLIGEDVFLITGPEDYFGKPKAVTYNAASKRLEYTFAASINPKSKMQLYAQTLKENYALKIKADKTTDTGYLVRLTCGSKYGLRLEWFSARKELVVYCYTRLLPKATYTDRVVLTMGKDAYPEAEVEALVQQVKKKVTMTEQKASSTAGSNRTRTFKSGSNVCLKTFWNNAAGVLTLEVYDDAVLTAMALKERKYFEKDDAKLPDLGAFLDRKCIGDQWGYARAITYSVDKTKGEKAFKEILSLLEEERYQLKLIQSRNYTDSGKSCTDYTYEYTGTNDDIDWVNHASGYNYHVKLTKKTYSHKLEIILYCWPEFYTDDPGSRSQYAGQLTPVEPEPEPEPDPTKPTGGGGGGTNECKTCYGSGKCWHCNGKGGKYRNVIGKPWEKVYEQCTTCFGGKKCKACKGKGWK